MVVTNAITFLSYASICGTLLYLTRRTRRVIARDWAWFLIGFALFIVACGSSHLMEVITTWIPRFWVDAWANIGFYCTPPSRVESAFIDPTLASKLASMADMQMHGGFVFGPAYPEWRSVDFHTEHVTLAVDGVVRVERTGSNTSGDLLKLIPWLANEGAARTGGLRSGQWITTGSWTGNTLATSSSAVAAIFSSVGTVKMDFA
jgi:hypothetical protein